MVEFLLPERKEFLLRAARATGFFSLIRQATRRQLRILAYHGLWTTAGYEYGDRLFISPTQFEQRLIWLKNSRYPVLSLGEAVARLESDSLPMHATVITIDDGWYSTYSHMLPILERHGLPATVYVTTWYSENQLPVINVAVRYILTRAGSPTSDAFRITQEIESLPSIEERELALRNFARRLGVTEEWWESRQFHIMSAAEIKDAHHRGLDVQLHTHRHKSVIRNHAGLAQELVDNRNSLIKACPNLERSLDHFCYPSGEYDPRATAILRSGSIKSAVVVDQGINRSGSDVYRLRRFLDGRSISQTKFEAYMVGALDLYDIVARQKVRFVEKSRTATELLTRHLGRKALSHDYGTADDARLEPKRLKP